MVGNRPKSERMVGTVVHFSSNRPLWPVKKLRMRVKLPRGKNCWVVKNGELFDE
jgi:hypothetical protein